MSRKIIILLLIIFAMMTALYMVSNNEGSEPSPALPETEVPSDYEDEIENRNTETIMDIYAQSQKGRLPDIPFIIGETVKEEVLARYGEPASIDDTDLGRYETYPEENLTVGYRDSTVFDLRRENNAYQEISRQEIIDDLGEPDKTTYFKESGYDHTIMIYTVGSSYALKWILDNSLNPENPFVDHISVVKESVPAEVPPSSGIRDTLDRMTLDEKIGQMIFAGIFGTEPQPASLELITEYHAGGIIFNSHNLSSPTQTVRYVNALKEANSINPIPLFFGIDQEGGRVSKLPGDLLPLPSALSIGERNSETYTYEFGRTLAELVHAYGFNMDFAPVLDVNSNPGNPVIGDRSFGNDPDLVTRHGILVMKGLQSGNVIPTIKHFPGHGDTSVDSHKALPTVPKTFEELENLELIPFENAVQEGADVVMIAHLLLPKLDQALPSSLSRIIINDLLRERMGFEGVVITDDLAMNAIADHYNIGDAAVMSINAGSDIIMVANNQNHMHSAVSGLKQAVVNGSLTEERIDESVMRILLLKEKYAINDAPTADADLQNLNAVIRSLDTVK